MRFVLSVLVSLSLALASPVCAKVYISSTFDLIEQANLIVVGVVQSVDEENVEVAVSEVLDGRLAPGVVTATPSTSADCLGRSIYFYVGEEVVLLLKDSGVIPFTVCGDGRGKVVLQPDPMHAQVRGNAPQPGTRSDRIQSFRALIPIARMTNDDAKNRAMLRAATWPNVYLRNEAQGYIGRRIARSNLVQNYTPQLVALLKDGRSDVKLAGLRGLEYAVVPEAAPLIIQATRDSDPDVVQAASLALARYDTAEASAALIARAKSGDQTLRIRAIVDLGNHSTRPESIKALISLLDDQDTKIRGHAACALVGAVRDKLADDALPRLVFLLQDPDDDVRMYAAQSLGESRNPSGLLPLLEAIGTMDKETRSHPMAVSAVYMIVSRADASARQLVQSNLPVIIDALNNGTWIAPMSAVSILGVLKTPEAIAALRDAGADHPDDAIRSLARDQLDRIEKQIKAN